MSPVYLHTARVAREFGSKSPICSLLQQAGDANRKKETSGSSVLEPLYLSFGWHKALCARIRIATLGRLSALQMLWVRGVM